MSNWDYRSPEPQEGNGCRGMLVALGIVAVVVLIGIGVVDMLMAVLS